VGPPGASSFRLDGVKFADAATAVRGDGSRPLGQARRTMASAACDQGAAGSGGHTNLAACASGFAAC
jgi:hypothetical protein